MTAIRVASLGLDGLASAAVPEHSHRQSKGDDAIQHGCCSITSEQHPHHIATSTDPVQSCWTIMQEAALR